MARVLVIDDDRALLRALRVGLASRGHEVILAGSGEEGLTSIAMESPDVVLLDLGLPDLDGLEVCRRAREWTGVAVIVLSATGLEARKVAALDGGADDYVTKPFGMAELDARIRAALRHTKPAARPEGAEVTVGTLAIDLVHRQAALGDEQLGLTGKELELLAFLARHAGKLCTHQMILQAVWGGQFGGEAESLRVHVHRLRRKLAGRGGVLIRTYPGIGYSLMSQPSSS